jgi:hypothetical protein
VVLFVLPVQYRVMETLWLLRLLKAVLVIDVVIAFYLVMQLG